MAMPIKSVRDTYMTYLMSFLILSLFSRKWAAFLEMLINDDIFKRIVPDPDKNHEMILTKILE